MKRNLVVGLVLVALGALLIIQNAIGPNIEIWSFVWPLFVLIPGISMHINYFSKENNSGNLVIAGILTTYGIYFLISVLTTKTASTDSFIYLFGIGIGFIESYIFCEKKSGYLSLAIIAFVFSLLIYLKKYLPKMVSLRSYIIPGILILTGVYILVKSSKIFDKRE